MLLKAMLQVQKYFDSNQCYLSKTIPNNKLFYIEQKVGKVIRVMGMSLVVEKSK